MSQVLASQTTELPTFMSPCELSLNKKLIHPKVLRATQYQMPTSPKLIVKDEHQPSKGDLKSKFFF